jgi:hypothetical protein
MQTTEIPYKLDHDGKGGLVAGRGNAGWTVATVTDPAAFLASLPRCAWMPGTHRIANITAGRPEFDGAATW